MKFIFIDETEQPQKDKNFFGLGAVIIDSANYSKFQEKASKNFKELKWPDKKEFKGRYLFSQKIDKNISVESRINFVKEFSKTSIANKNARYSFIFAYNFNKNTKKNYLFLLTKILKKINVPAKCKNDVCLLGLFFDNTSLVKIDDVIDIVNQNLKVKLKILERPFFIKSDNKTFGIMAVDILCYLKSWVELNEDDKDAQKSLFSKAIGSIDKKKLETINEIISNIKNIKVIL